LGWWECSPGPEVLHGRKHYFHPSSGDEIVGWPEWVEGSWYVELVEDWVSIDLDGVRWAPSAPTLYGVTD
jgi:hypothetical protein